MSYADIMNGVYIAPPQPLIAGTVPVLQSNGTASWQAVSGITSPTRNNSIMFVSSGGSDSNDGLTWQTAKKTVYNAILSLPGGNATTLTAGTGIVYFSSGSSATPFSNTGLWLMGADDPNFLSPPTGWIKIPNNFGSLSVIGIPTVNSGANPHLGRAFLNGPNTNADKNHPGVWLSAVQSLLYFENIAVANFLSRCWVIGEDSNNGRTGNGECAGISFKNCSGSLQTTASTFGPCWDITGGSFWIFLVDCSGQGNVITAGPSTITAATFLIDGVGNSGTGLIFFQGLTNTSQGGIILRCGSNGGSVFVDGITQEGSFSASSPVQPCVWITSDGANANAIARIDNAEIADGGSNPMPAVQNDGGSSAIFVTNPVGQTINTQGKMTVFGEYQNNLQNQTVSTFRQKQAGFTGGWGSAFYKVYGIKDDARRNFMGLSRFTNTAKQQTSSWVATSGSVTLTTGITAPDGTSNAGRISNSSGVLEGVYLNGSVQVNISFSVGDWVIIGCWVRSNSGNGPIQLPVFASLVTVGFAPSTINAGSWIQGDGEWQWVTGLAKVSATGSNPCAVEFLAATDNVHVLDLYAPVFIHIPTGTISDNEVYEVAMALTSFRDDAPIGSVSLPRGEIFMSDGLQMPKITTSASAPGAEMGFLRWEAGTNAGTLKLVAYAGTSTTGVTVIDNVGSGN